jgi:hypothetical protein
MGSNWERVYRMAFASVYPAYIAKAEKGLKRTVRADSAGFDPGRAKEQVDDVIRWLTGYSQGELEAEIAAGTDMRTFFESAPRPNPARSQVTGVICGDRVETIEEPLKREIRTLDKLVDELAKGKAMEKILRSGAATE